MCVGMGSFLDPYEAQGLAHFLGIADHFYSEVKYIYVCYFTGYKKSVSFAH